MNLSSYENSGYERGRSWIVRLLWYLLQAVFVSSALPGSFHRRLLLRMFGAGVGRGVILKPGIRIKFPWRLTIGADSWIGESVWIDNLDDVLIGSNCCISQGAYICTGNHDWSAEDFRLETRPVIIQDQSWICAGTSVGPGVVVGEGAVLTLGSAATGNLEAWSIYAGVPASRTAMRKKPDEDSDAFVLETVFSVS